MGQHMPQEDPACLIIDFSDETIRVSFDVENRKLSHGIGRREHTLHLHQILPLGFLRHPVPGIQGFADLTVSASRFEELLATDYMQTLAAPSIRFANCELVKGEAGGVLKIRKGDLPLDKLGTNPSSRASAELGFGGGGGSRTPVRRSPGLKAYMRIQFVCFRRRRPRTDKSRRQLARKSRRSLTDRKGTASLHK